MASVYKEIVTKARPELVWDAIRDVGALHTRLVPGFVVDTRVEAGARIVTFASGLTVREAIITTDEERRRLVWSVQPPALEHHNGSVQVFPGGEGRTRVVWMADFLPDSAASRIDAAMEAGMAAMRKALDEAAERV
jgi:hypothetical protein